MRLWSVHPRYLDAQGLVALWRETLLARAVLRGETKGYRFHPQLERFRAHGQPRSAVSAYLRAVHAEAARVLRPGGRWVFAVTHPLRWAFPDDPEGLTAIRSYFDRRPYVELGSSGSVLYAEYHRTLGDHVADVVGAGLVLDRVVEPEWPAGHERTWGGWGPVRGALLPGTAIFVTHRP